jgi:hypothetical protein
VSRKAKLPPVICSTRSVFLDHEHAKSELKAWVPEDAKEASGHCIRAKRSRSGAVSFDILASGEWSHVAGETIGALAAALAKAQAELTNPEKALIAIRASNPRDQRSDLSLCGAEAVRCSPKVPLNPEP